MENELYIYYGYTSDCELRHFFQYLFENENFEIVNKILSESETLCKIPKFIESDYFIEDSQMQEQNSLKKNADKPIVEFNNKEDFDNIDCKTEKTVKHYLDKESNYSNEFNNVLESNVEPIIVPIIIHMSTFEEKDEYIYVNLKMTTIVFLTLLLDSKLPIGITAATLGALGINTTLITKLDEVKGENCILLEICSKKNRKISSDFYKIFNKGDCTNNHFNCKHRKEGKCTITEEAIKTICDYFVDRNIIKLEGNYYKYTI